VLSRRLRRLRTMAGVTDGGFLRKTVSHAAVAISSSTTSHADLR
jgi:hypothetical protein